MLPGFSMMLRWLKPTVRWWSRLPDHIIVVEAVVPNFDVVPPIRAGNPGHRPDLPDPGAVVAADEATDAVFVGKSIIALDRVDVLLGLGLRHCARVVEGLRRVVRLWQ